MIRETTFRDSRAIELKTSRLHLVAPVEYGPRLMHFGAASGGNLLLQMEDEEPGGASGEYCFRGGHRLWHAPEHPVRTYQPDNDALHLETLENGFLLRQPVERDTGIVKQVEVRAVADDTLRVRHFLTNDGKEPFKGAPWALTMFRGGGRCVMPLPPKGEHPRDLLPGFSFVQWPYADLSLECWKFSRSFIGIEIPKVPSPQKVGLSSWPGWIGYWLEGVAFVKFVSTDPRAVYPDFGCQMEVFSDGKMIELETLGGLTDIAPGETVTHDEYWTIIEGLPEPKSEGEVAETWFPSVGRWIRSFSGSEANR